ncbi:uncharacterized protein EI90DRAFT_623072 [Cantharellus anzutake]|uniref:uncharacterized protein n=1 Tax=Cantharellus anzutake TaxID=1750568 RepID=UPI001906C099|nr:uncharacterized protein EI90DRAFT_623072 [Cantharellus anzutake]KAF8333080.1 hypothetical protein EI90DRAFT_623072 [Cantharellus anzutake]
MRRGRPSVGTSLAPASAPLSPIKSGPSKITERPRRFSKPTADSVTSSPSIISDMNAWRIGTTHHPTTKSQPRVNGFEDSFQTSSSAQVISPSPSPKPPPLPNRNRPPPPARQHHRTGPVVPMNAKQGAFEALDPTLVSRPPPRTLGSLSISTSVDSSTGPGLRSPSAPYLGPKASKVTGDYLSYSSTSNKASRSPSSPSAQLSVEERFPSLEGLDQHFAKAGIGSPSLSSNKVSGKSSSSGLVLPTLGNTSSSQTSPAPDRFQASIRSLGSGTPAGTRTASTRPPSPSGPRSRSPLTSPEIRPRDLPPPSSYGMQQAGTRFATASFSPLSTRPSVEKLPGHGAKPPVNHATKPSLSKLDVGQSSSAPSSQSWSKESPGTPAVVAQTRNLLDEIFASDASLPSPLVASSTRHLVPPPVATSYRGDAPSIPKSQTPSPRLQGALRPPERRNSPRSGESSGGDENPEDPVPRRASRVWGVPRATSPSQSPNLIPSSTRGVSPTGSNPARKSYHGPSHARKTSAYDLIDAPPPTSNSVATHTGGQRSPSRQGRRQASAYDLVDIEKPLASSITQPMGTQLGQSPQDKQFTGSRVSYHDRQFTGNRVPGGTYSSPSLSPVPNPANAKIQGGPRPRPQSMFLTSSNLLIPPSVPSDVSTPNGTGASPRRESHRRLSISDMVSKYEEVVRGALAPEISRQGNVSKTPTGAFPLTKVTTPKLLPTTTPPSTSPSKAHATQPSSQYKPQRSPVMTSFPPSGLAQSTDPGPLNSPVTRSYTRPAANTPLQHTGLPTVKRLREPSPENEQQPSHAPRTESTKLNVVPPPDFTGRQDRPPSPARPGRVSPAAHSPTPERPYQGVSKLIDQWQKKSEAAMGESNVIGRKPLGSGRTFR